MGTLDPEQTYRTIIARFTDIPAADFVFGIRRSHAGEAACAAP